MKKNKLLNESGMALVITMGILLLVTLMAVAFFSSQHTEKMASTNYRYGVIAEEIADGYLNVAINMLVDDRDGDSAYEAYDSLYELWGPKYAGGDSKRFSFQAVDSEGVNFDEVIVGAAGGDEDARWIDVLDNTQPIPRPIGRVAVLVMPENSKINLNTAGDVDHSAPPADEKFDGYTTFAIDYFDLLVALPLEPGYPLDAGNANRTVNWKYSGDPADATGGPGAEGVDDGGAQYADNNYVTRDKVDNDGDGEVDEAGEGVDDPFEYFFQFGSPNVHSLYENDFRYQDPRMTLIAWNGAADVNKNKYDQNNLGTYLTTFSYENDLIDFEGKERVRINQWAFPYQDGSVDDASAGNKTNLAEKIRDEFTAQGMGVPLASQLAVNIVDYCDYDFNDDNIRADVRTQLVDSGDANKPYLGIEKTVYIHEVNGASYNDPANAFLDQDPDDDYIELINISDRDIDLSGWEIKVGGNSPVEITSGTIKKWSGWSSTDHFMILAVEPGPDPIEIIDEIIQIPVASGYGFWIKNGHSFMDDVKTVPNDQIIDMKELRISLVGNDRITLLDNNGNIVDVSDSSDGLDSPNNVISWQRKDPTMDFGAVATDDTACDFNDNDGHPATDTDKENIWLEQRPSDNVWEVKHVKDRYFSSVAEIAKVSSPMGNWYAFINRGSMPSTNPAYDNILAVIDKFTIAHEFDDNSKMASQVDGTAVIQPDKFGIGPRITHIIWDSVNPDDNMQALVRGKININAIADNEQRYIYNAIRIFSNPNHMEVLFLDLQNYLISNGGFGEPDSGGNYMGIGGLKNTSPNQMFIEDFIAVSNLLTTKSNVFKITILAQAYDRKFNVSAERKLEVIVDRGYVIDAGAPSYSPEAKEEAKQIRVLSYRWVTEEE